MEEKDEGDLVTDVSDLASSLDFCREYRHAKNKRARRTLPRANSVHMKEKRGGGERPYTNSIADGLDAVASD
jgi:hypothetical protein